MDIKVRRALVSVSDKEGIVDFSGYLGKNGVELFSTGGTYKVLSENDISVKKVEELTGFPEMLDGRVKTLHPMVHGGILANREDKKHLKEVEAKGIKLIDMVVVNLYPFRQTIEKQGVTMADAIENIDIGGPTMIRSSAKNYKSVAVIVDPEDYKVIIDELEKNNMSLCEDTLFNLSLKAFQHTCEYDSVIFNYFSDISKDFTNTGLKVRRYLNLDCTSAESEKLKDPKSPSYRPDDGIWTSSSNKAAEEAGFRLKKINDLRYGENPHQRAAYYKIEPTKKDSFVNAKQLQGKQLSYNNILDSNAAFMIVKEFERPCVAVIKHNNPCGAALADDVLNAYKDAYACDPVSAFGSIVASNKKWTKSASEFLKDKYVEVLIAPSFEDEALQILESKTGMRILKIDYEALPYIDKISSAGFRTDSLDIKSVDGGMLIQDLDEGLDDKDTFKVATKQSPSEEQLRDLVFGWQLIKNVKSNAIVLVKGEKTVGIGAGQMSRVDSTKLSIEKSEGRAPGSVLISDAFFPFKDAIEIAAKNGIRAIIQPGGSVNDEEVIKSCNDNGIAMVFTGKRHFKH